MQLVKEGPDIPVELLQALEDGELVFFCGAGVSSRAGLPGFEGLVKKVYAQLGQEMDTQETREFKAGRYECVLGLLENRLQRGIVREAVIQELTIQPGANLSTHQALITLSTNRHGFYRLVTTKNLLPNYLFRKSIGGIA